MGQYFKAVNFDKREVVCPWCLGGGAKLWEWSANAYGAIFPLLLRKSSATGGGDFGYGPPRTVDINSFDGASAHEQLLNALRQSALSEGQPIHLSPDSVVGRWAGDRVALIGDYDVSRLWDELPAFRNVSGEVVEA